MKFKEKKYPFNPLEFGNTKGFTVPHNGIKVECNLIRSNCASLIQILI